MRFNIGFTPNGRRTWRRGTQAINHAADLSSKINAAG
jgi:hypothetical protein